MTTTNTTTRNFPHKTKLARALYSHVRTTHNSATPQVPALCLPFLSLLFSAGTAATKMKNLYIYVNTRKRRRKRGRRGSHGKRMGSSPAATEARRDWSPMLMTYLLLVAAKLELRLGFHPLVFFVCVLHVECLDIISSKLFLSSMKRLRIASFPCKYFAFVFFCFVV
jgi:hypothetical protein